MTWRPSSRSGAWSLANLLRIMARRGSTPSGTPIRSSRAGIRRRPISAAAAGRRRPRHRARVERTLAGCGARPARKRGAPFTLLFHDTHHRAVSEPDAMRRFDLDGYDGVLAFGEALAAVYRGWGWGDRVVVWHEAADTRLFRPPPRKARGRAWSGSATGATTSAAPSSRDSCSRPRRRQGCRSISMACATRTRRSARSDATARGIAAGYRMPRAPAVFARHPATVHVPRRFYVEQLPGIPTIRVFEALACGIPLVCAPWQDSEGLFHPGQDYLVARTRWR